MGAVSRLDVDPGPLIALRPLMLAALSAALCLCPACGDDDPGTVVHFDLDGATVDEGRFWDHPWPSDLRLLPDGAPDLTGFPSPRDTPIFADLLAGARDRSGFPAMPVIYFRFTGPLAPRAVDDVIPATVDAPVLLVDIDPDSPARGHLVPTVALTLIIDDYVSCCVLAVAPRPGFILDGGRRWAAVVMRSLGDEQGRPLGVAPAIADLAGGRTPGGARGAEAAALMAPLWETLDQLGVDRDQVAAATVFTTADVVTDLAGLSDGLLARYQLTADGLTLDPDDGDHPRYCELLGTLALPQFQRGNPPFDQEGLFEIADDGLPVEQRMETVPVVVTIPKAPMPPGGYPLVLYFHGSGGLSSEVVDRGRVVEVGGEWTQGEGPAHVLAPYGLATAGSALPVNPERVPGAADIAYLNLDNLPAMRDTFRQGVIEQRLYLEALLDLEIPASALAGCTGPSLPDGETTYHFDPAQVVAQGQSMGGMYTNLISAVEPRIRAAVPTGAGGFWGYFILHTTLISGTTSFLSVVLGTPEPALTFMHPGMHLLALAWEPIEPFISMPRLARRPLPGHPVRPIYEPVGKDDRYFPTVLYDAVALAYGHQQAGEQVWPTMQEALALADLDGIVAYPVSGNVVSDDGTPYTGVVVQYQGDGIEDSHSIYNQLDEVKYQYGCFLATFLAAGVATVPAPQPLGTPCL